MVDPSRRRWTCQVVSWLRWWCRPHSTCRLASMVGPSSARARMWSTSAWPAVFAAAWEAAAAVAVPDVAVQRGAGAVGVGGGVEELAVLVGDESPPGAVGVEGQRAGQFGGDVA